MLLSMFLLFYFSIILSVVTNFVQFNSPSIHLPFFSFVFGAATPLLCQTTYSKKSSYSAPSNENEIATKTQAQ